MFARLLIFYLNSISISLLTGVLGVRVLAVLIGQQQTRVRLTNLRNARRAKKYSFENDLTFARSRSPGFINEP